MYYFNSFPKISTIDYSGNLITLTNIMNRVEIKPALLNNSLLFYSYDIQDGDTPDIIASKYYGNSYRYWFVMLGNQMLDPQWEWPLTSQQFMGYLADKYLNATANSLNVAANTISSQQVISYCLGTVYQYTKTITTVDTTSLVSTSKTIVIDQPTYNTTLTQTTTQTFSSGDQVVQTITKNAQSIYDYENQLNESKRNINLINASYAPEFESQFASLLGK